MPRLRSPALAGVLALLCAVRVVHAQPAATPPGVAAEADGPAPAAPVVVRPELVQFQRAPYPEAAKEAGVEGAVVLRLVIDPQGNVITAEVIGSAGHGFDEAARTAALGFKWKPATVDGRPVPVRIDYEYRFTLEAALPPPSAAPPRAHALGNLSGQVTVGGTNLPLAGATVQVLGADGVDHRLATDVDGRWSFTELSPGEYHVSIDVAGYRHFEAAESVVAGEATEVTYRMVAEVSGIDIVIQGQRPLREVTRRAISQREIARVPGTGGDALRSIEALPGVARPPAGLAGLLIIRGSDPNDSAAFIDGAEVPLIYHFGGLSSVIPTEAIERFDLYPGNFSARYGRYLGGLVDVALRPPNTRCHGPYMRPSDREGCYHGLVELDLLNTRFVVEGPIPGLKKWSLFAAGRRSWFDSWLRPILEATDAGVTTSPVYWDYQLIAETKPRPDSKLSLRLYGSDDRVEVLIDDPIAEDPSFGGTVSFGTSVHQGQLLYEDQLDRHVTLTTMVSAGKTDLDFSFGMIEFLLDLFLIQYRTEFAWVLSKGFRLNGGLDFQLSPGTVFVRAPDPPDAGEPSPGPFANRPPRESEVDFIGFRPAWYLEGELTPTARLRLVPGVRIDYARDTSHGDFSPRLTGRYDIVHPTLDARRLKPRLRTTAKVGVGVFHRPPTFQETSEEFGTPGLRSNRAIHYSVGAEQQLTERVELSVEGFYKDMRQLVARTANDRGSFTYGNDGVGSAIGLETFLKYKPDRHFFGWIAYTLSRSARKDHEDEPAYLFEYDQTHNLTVLGSYRLGRGWEVGGRFRLVSGTLYTPVLSEPALSALYAADAGSYVALQGDLYSQRLPLIHQLDLRLDKRWQFKAFRFAGYLDLRNAYNNAAVEALSYNYNYTQTNRTKGFPILPALGIRGEF
ncbi:MAG: TonB-dependent receptor [Polyangiaceae bacterium]|nr:TonB-dependent receptor [Polyangiaceae bacterium]